MSSKNMKPTIEGAKNFTPVGKIVLSGIVKSGGVERHHSYAISVATMDEVKHSLTNIDTVGGPVALEIVAEYVVYVHIKKSDSKRIQGFETGDIGDHATPHDFETVLLNHARNYFQRYEYWNTRRKIEDSKTTIDDLIRRLNKIPHELLQSQRIGDSEYTAALESGITRIGKIIGCTKTARNLISLLTTTDTALEQLCPHMNYTLFHSGGILHDRKLYEQKFLELRKSTDYARVYSALINTHVERMTALIQGDYDIYASKGKEISKLFSVMPLFSETIKKEDDSEKEPPQFESHLDT